jgi:hypothetical protein
MKIFQENKNVEKQTYKKISTMNKEIETEKSHNEDVLMPSKIKYGKATKDKYISNINFYNNSNICYRFGQVNIEKALFVLLFQMIFTALLIYLYIYDIAKILIYLFLISAGIDMILMTIFIYFVMKFRQDEIFSTFSRGVSNFVDIVNSINLIFKFFNYTFIFFVIKDLTFFFCLWFTLKILIEIYFALITLKIFVFCSCTVWINEKLYGLFKMIQYYILCCETEEKEENKEHERFEELESNY